MKKQDINHFFILPGNGPFSGHCKKGNYFLLFHLFVAFFSAHIVQLIQWLWADSRVCMYLHYTWNIRYVGSVMAWLSDLLDQLYEFGAIPSSSILRAHLYMYIQLLHLWVDRSGWQKNAPGESLNSTPHAWALPSLKGPSHETQIELKWYI